MILTFFDKPNFGDAVNTLIFDRLLPDFFDQDNNLLFLGIGSILGLYFGSENTRRIIVFSSGFAYGDLPEINQKYDIRCVRGPLTARALNISPGLAVTDGAALLSLFPEFNGPVTKKYSFSLIPHHHSEVMFDRWDDILKEHEINHISPSLPTAQAIDQIRQSEVILAEAMHGAIIADCLRIPWIPVKMFQHINAFKWTDWAKSMNLEYNPHTLTSLFNEASIQQILSTKFPFNTSSLLSNGAGVFYKKYQETYKKKRFNAELKEIKNKTPVLSEESLLRSKVNQLMEILESIKKDYGQEIITRNFREIQ